jgi:hypothetical protein
MAVNVAGPEPEHKPDTTGSAHERAEPEVPPPVTSSGVPLFLRGAAFGHRAADGVPPPVQRKSGKSGIASDRIHYLASHGVAEPAQPLPHRDQIQTSFGPAHDLSTVRAYVGGSAAEAAIGMDATAFTVGHDVAFQTDPDLRLAAHEATHVVQQRKGVNLIGNVSHAGDPYERHADAVADRVVAGQSSADMLASLQSGTVATPLVQRDEATTDTPAARIQRLIADNDIGGIVALTEAELAAATVEQRVGMVRILADQTWTSENDERAMLRLIRRDGQHVKVLTTLDAIGYRQRLLDSVDTDALHQELETLLADAKAPATVGDAAITQALTSRKPTDVLAITDFSKATKTQRLGLLQILLNMSSSNTEEEAKILDILESSGTELGPLMNDLRDVGLKQSLFDHIDEEKNKLRLTTLLQTLNSVELNRDLEVFNTGAGWTFLYAVGGGFVSAWEKFSLVGLLMGLLQPILHPIETILHLVDKVAIAIKNPTWDTILTALRDIAGALAIWCLALAAICVVLAALVFGLGLLLIETIAGALVCLVMMGYLLAAAKFFFAGAHILGVAFLVLAAAKLIVDVFQGSAATTERELEREQEQIGEGITLGLFVLLVLALFKVAGGVAKRLRRNATEPDVIDSEKLGNEAKDVKDQEGQVKKQGDELEKAGDEAKRAADEAKEAELKKSAAEEKEAPADEARKAAEEAEKAAPPEENELAPAEEKQPAPPEEKQPVPEGDALQAAAGSLLDRLNHLKRRAYEVLKRADELEDVAPDQRRVWRQRANALRDRLEKLERDIEDATSLEEITELLEREVNEAESELSALENELPQPVAPGGEADVPRPHLRHPTDKLPTGGAHPYNSAQPGPEVAPNPRGAGYLDADGNVWQVDRTKTQWFEWDVQHPNGLHTNVGVEGNVTHGPDNF